MHEHLREPIQQESYKKTKYVLCLQGIHKGGSIKENNDTEDG